MMKAGEASMLGRGITREWSERFDQNRRILGRHSVVRKSRRRTTRRCAQRERAERRGVGDRQRGWRR